MEKKEIFMVSALSFSVGVILGFLFSPVKEGVYNIAGNTTNYNYSENRQPTGSGSEN